MPDPTGGVLTAIAPTVVGGLMGGSSDAPTQTSQNQIDPRMAKFIYGENGSGGLLGDAQQLYQANRGGLNSQMLQGMNSQWNTLNSPAASQGYDTMGGLGMSLLGAGVASNPFTSGAMPAFGRMQSTGTAARSAPSQGFTFSPQQQQAATPGDLVAQGYAALGRSPDASGAEWWRNELAQGRVAPQDFMHEFLRGAMQQGNPDYFAASNQAPQYQRFTAPQFAPQQVATTAQQAAMQQGRALSPQEQYYRPILGDNWETLLMERG